MYFLSIFVIKRNCIYAFTLGLKLFSNLNVLMAIAGEARIQYTHYVDIYKDVSSKLFSHISLWFAFTCFTVRALVEFPSVSIVLDNAVGAILTIAIL